MSLFTHYAAFALGGIVAWFVCCCFAVSGRDVE